MADPRSRKYPIRPEDGQAKTLFTIGLTIDVARVLKAHGFPEVTDGPDFVDLEQALFRFVFGGGR
jgi:hypothetical protein